MTPHITPEELCGYLPSGLEWQIVPKDGNESSKIDKMTLMEVSDKYIVFENTGDYYFQSDENDFVAKPLVRPWSHLTKPIINKGEEVVPILLLAKIVFPEIKETSWAIGDEGALAYWKGRTRHLDFENGDFYCNGELYPSHVPNQLALFQKLYEMKFDLHDWLGRGLGVELSNH